MLYHFETNRSCVVAKNEHPIPPPVITMPLLMYTLQKHPIQKEKGVEYEAHNRILYSKWYYYQVRCQMALKSQQMMEMDFHSISSYRSIDLLVDLWHLITPFWKNSIECLLKKASIHFQQDVFYCDTYTWNIKHLWHGCVLPYLQSNLTNAENMYLKMRGLITGIFRDPLIRGTFFSTHTDFIAHFERTFLY